jgi:hypothetical protein
MQLLAYLTTTLCNCQRTVKLVPSSWFQVQSFHNLELCTFELVTIFLVEVNGFEPMTSCVQGRRSPS